MNDKRCSTCKQTKSISEFGVKRRELDGYNYQCKSCNSIATKKYREKYGEEIRRKVRIAARKRKKRIKIEVLTHYGGNSLACVKCGFDDIRALSIDHINGGGGQHKKGLKLSGGGSLYDWLQKQGYPEGYQTLCMNCQYVKRDENQEHRYKLKD